MADLSTHPLPLDLIRTSILRAPLRSTDIDSWHGHIPFAFWCIDALRPQIFVELGTHKGDSYCAFCQAVDERLTGTRCFAVDTWKGDPQAGFYDDDVYEELRLHHNQRYGRFSRLIRSTFEDALPHFLDGSIDLLHLDGEHGYDEIRRDFTSWLPKVSERGVVLFHDIGVREAGFGVWRLWEELRRDYPSFSFLHSHGLGVLVVGSKPPDPVLRLASLDERTTEGVRSLFERLGDAVRFQGAQQEMVRRGTRIATLEASLREGAQHSTQLEESLRDSERRNAKLQASFEESERRNAKLQASFEESERRNAKLQASFEESERRNAKLQASFEESERRNAKLQASSEESERRSTELRTSLEVIENRASTLAAERDALLRSRSWRICAPMRVVGRLVRRLRSGPGPSTEVVSNSTLESRPEPDSERSPDN